MKKIIIKERDYPQKPEWRIVLDHLIYQDEIKVFRICRKMIIHLDRIRVPEIRTLIEELNPTDIAQDNEQAVGANWPKPKGSPFVAKDIIERVFDIADKYIKDEDITNQVVLWINQENLGFLSNVLEKRTVPMIDIIHAVKKFLKISNNTEVLSVDELIGLRVSLISRFLSENLTYINIAKRYITIRVMAQILDRVIGPPHGTGKLGGKSAGMILAREILIEKRRINPLLENVSTPKSRFLTSDTIFEFLHYNALEEFVHVKYQKSEEIKQEYPFLEYIFKNSRFPPETNRLLEGILDDMDGRPIVVRSSSLLEDSFEASFSGKYKSLFLANQGPKNERLINLTNAIAEVYASTFGPDPIEYRSERKLLDFREEMGVLIQQVVGNKIGKYYLPSFAGVAFSNNEMRWSPRIKREDGIVRLVAGLGTRAVDRTIDDYPKLVSPGQPGLQVNLSVPEQIRYSQRYVDVINLETNSFETIEFSNLIDESGGYFPGIENIVSFDRQGTLVDPVSNMANFAKEDLVVTFNRLISSSTFITQIREILNELKSAFGQAVDIEFASSGSKLYLLQCRPQSKFEEEELVKIPQNVEVDSIVFNAKHYVSNGVVMNVQYLVYVDAKGYKSCKTSEDLHNIGKIINLLNKRLPKKKFVLIGPGRWGSKGDIKLGVPVIYSDINNTAMLIEVAKESDGYVPELSFGTHFFQDLVEANIKYLPLYPDKEGIIFREDIFLESENQLPILFPSYAQYSDVVKVVDIDLISSGKRVNVYMDGDANEALAIIK
jgi:pyruvate, water dikinase